MNINYYEFDAHENKKTLKKDSYRGPIEIKQNLAKKEFVGFLSKLTSSGLHGPGFTPE